MFAHFPSLDLNFHLVCYLGNLEIFLNPLASSLCAWYILSNRGTTVIGCGLQIQNNVGQAKLACTIHISFRCDLRWGGGKEKMATGD